MQKLISGPGALGRLADELKQDTASLKIAVITFGNARKQEAITGFLDSLRLKHPVLHLPFSTPLLCTTDLTTISKTLENKGFSPNMIVAIGGGAVLDLAKCVKHKINHKPCLIAVPTTAGTGSEATPFATVYEDGKKLSIEDPCLTPETVVLDPLLLLSLPRPTLLHTGFDALAQAMESIWSIRATAGSIDDALQAVRGILKSGFPWITRSPALTDLQIMQESAYLSGRAICVSRTTLAHALSYALTARLGVPHGLAVFLNLGNVIRYNGMMNESECTDPQGFGHYQLKMSQLFFLFGVMDHEALAIRMDVLLNAVDPSTYPATSSAELNWMIQSALDSPRSGNNPRKPTREAMTALWNTR